MNCYYLRNDCKDVFNPNHCVCEEQHPHYSEHENLVASIFITEGLSVVGVHARIMRGLDLDGETQVRMHLRDYHVTNLMTISVFMRDEEVNLEEVTIIVLRLNDFSGRFIVTVSNVDLDLQPSKVSVKVKVIPLAHSVD